MLSPPSKVGVSQLAVMDVDDETIAEPMAGDSGAASLKVTEAGKAAVTGPEPTLFTALTLTKYVLPDSKLPLSSPVKTSLPPTT